MRRAIIELLAIAFVTVTAPVSAADGFPQLKPGLWEFSRAKGAFPAQGKPPTQSVRQCTSPAEDMKKKWTQLATGECRFTPITRNGNRYTYTSVCKRYGAEFQLRSVVTVNSEADYRVETQTRGAGGASNEVVIAHRLGDCAPTSTPLNASATPLGQ